MSDRKPLDDRFGYDAQTKSPPLPVEREEGAPFMAASHVPAAAQYYDDAPHADNRRSSSTSSYTKRSGGAGHTTIDKAGTLKLGDLLDKRTMEDAGIGIGSIAGVAAAAALTDDDKDEEEPPSRTGKRERKEENAGKTPTELPSCTGATPATDIASRNWERKGGETPPPRCCRDGKDNGGSWHGSSNKKSACSSGRVYSSHPKTRWRTKGKKRTGAAEQVEEEEEKRDLSESNVPEFSPISPDRVPLEGGTTTMRGQQIPNRPETVPVIEPDKCTFDMTAPESRPETVPAIGPDERGFCAMPSRCRPFPSHTATLAEDRSNPAFDDERRQGAASVSLDDLPRPGAFEVGGSGNEQDAHPSDASRTETGTVINNDAGDLVVEADLAPTEEGSAPVIEAMKVQPVTEEEEGFWSIYGKREKICFGSFALAIAVGIAVGLGVALSDRSSRSTKALPMSSTILPSVTPTTSTPTTTPIPSPTFDAEFIARVKICSALSSTCSDLSVEGTPQFKALEWVVSDSNYESFPEWRRIQRYVLAVVAFSLEGWGGVDWRGDCCIVDWRDGGDEECSWVWGPWPNEKIECDSSGRATAIGFDSDLVATGNVPRDLVLLSSSLQELHFSWVDFSGSISTELGMLSELKILHLSGNKLEGSISSELGLLTKLEWLDLYDNELESSIPSELGLLTNLEHLELSSNKLEGAIPSELGLLTNLERLSLYYNKLLEGTIPSVLSLLTNLEYLDLSRNKLEGSIPSELGLLTNLEHLELSSNKLEDVIPSELGLLTNLEWLTLSWNKLEGTIPSVLGRLTSLRYLWLYNNDLTGSMPAEVCALRTPEGQLEDLDADCKREVECAKPECCTKCY